MTFDSSQITIPVFNLQNQRSQTPGETACEACCVLNSRKSAVSIRASFVSSALWQFQFTPISFLLESYKKEAAPYASSARSAVALPEFDKGPWNTWNLSTLFIFA